MPKFRLKQRKFSTLKVQIKCVKNREKWSKFGVWHKAWNK